MRGRLIVAGLVAIASVALVFVAPNGLPAVKEMYAAEQQSYETYERAQTSLKAAETALTKTVEEYNATRGFDIYYGDIDRIIEVLEGLPGIEIFRVTVVDPMDNFGERELYQSGCEHSAIKLELAISDISAALTILDKLDIPLESVCYSHPNTLTVIFLTGGTV